MDVTVHTLEELTYQAQNLMKTATGAFIELGRVLKTIHSSLPGPEWTIYLKETLKMDKSLAHKTIKVYEEFGGSEEAHALSFTVLRTLLGSDDPQARLKEALAAQEAKGAAVTVKEAKEIAKKAKALVDEGEVETFTVPSQQAREEAIAEIESSLREEQVDTAEAASLRRVRRAKRALKTVFDLLVLEMSEEIFDTDIVQACIEMLEGDDGDKEMINQLKAFCGLIVDAGE